MEIVYTFPLPSGAVLLGVDVRLGERQLSGAVVEKRQAAQAYEDGMTSCALQISSVQGVMHCKWWIEPWHSWMRAWSNPAL